VRRVRKGGVGGGRAAVSRRPGSVTEVAGVVPSRRRRRRMEGRRTSMDRWWAATPRAALARRHRGLMLAWRRAFRGGA
jgi:hypothetical protein